jgi:hypothetical protein
MYLHTKTVEHYVASIYAHLGLASSTDNNKRVLAVLGWLRTDISRLHIRPALSDQRSDNAGGIWVVSVTERCALIGCGFHVWATVRREVDEQRLLATHADRVTVRRCDITDPDQVAALGAEVVAGGLVGLVSNAGIAVPSPLEYLPLDHLRHQLEVNLAGQLAVVQAVLPALRRTRGTSPPPTSRSRFCVRSTQGARGGRSPRRSASHS